MNAIKLGVFSSLIFVSCFYIAPGDPVPLNQFKYTLTNEPNTAGMNVWFLTDWDDSRAFSDAIKHGAPWQKITNGALAAVNPRGWPNEDAYQVFMSRMDPTQDNGVYHLVFDGQADVTLEWTGGSVTAKSYDSVLNRTTADVTINCQPDHAARLIFRNTKLTSGSPTGTGVRNVRLYRPGHPVDGSQVIANAFKAALNGQSPIRTMDWLATNVNLIQTWADRTLPTDCGPGRLPPQYSITYPSASILNDPNIPNPNYGSFGCAIEDLIALCNETNSDLWINIPVLADQNYIEKMSDLLKFGSDGTNPYTSTQTTPVYPPLKPSLKIYVEFANEIWNSSPGFWNFPIIYDIIAKDTGGALPVSSDGTTDIYQRMWRYPAYRLAEASKVLALKFPGEMMTRVRPILSTQLGDGQGTLSQALTWAYDYYSPGLLLKDLFYGGGGSAYYTVTKPDPDIEKLLSPTNYPDENFMKDNARDSTWVNAYGLKRVAYEGGFGLDIRYSAPNYNLMFSNDQQAVIARDPRVLELQELTHHAWSQTGGDLLVYYCIIGPVSWGFLEKTTDMATPKMKALKRTLSSNKAALTLGGVLPGTVVVKDLYPGNTSPIRTGYDYPQTIDSLPCVGGNDVGEMVAIPVRTEGPILGNLTVRGQSGSPGGAVIGIWAQGTKVGTVSLAQGSHLVDSSTLSMSLAQGLTVIRLEVDSGSYSLRSITLEP